MSLNVPLSLLMVFAVVAYQAEGQFRRLKSILNKLKYLNIYINQQDAQNSCD